jgi:restriction endonuclease S subunit
MELIGVNFSDLASDFDLRFDPKFYKFAISNNFSLINTGKFPLVKLKDLLIPDYNLFKYEDGRIYNGLPTSSEYFDEDGEVLKYLPVTKNKHPERLKYEARSGQLLISSLKDAKAPVVILKGDCRGVVLSNGFYIFKFKENARGQRILWKYVYYLLKSGLMRTILNENLSRGIGISAYKEIDLLKIRIPVLPEDLQKDIVERVEKIEDKIRREKQKLVPVQEVIENVFVKYGVKSSNFQKMQCEPFTTDFVNIIRNTSLRCGVKYRMFWDVEHGLLFAGSNYPVKKLGSLIKLHKTKILKKGTLDKEYILIELEDIEERTGKILNLKRTVIDIDSDKVYFGDSDILTTKLRPYLGYTILNIPGLELIGTTELMPFKIINNQALPAYIKYLLLSYEYLEKSAFLMYGKEHPRIHLSDLLNIRVPSPSIDIQEKVVSEIEKEEKFIEEAKKNINRLREEINSIVFENFFKDKEI